MLELPEVLARARELNEALAGKAVAEALPPSAHHKFCWFSLPPEEYAARLKGRGFDGAEGFGIFVEMNFGGERLCVNDGVTLRLLPPEEKRPAKYQLMLVFADGWALAFTVSMYGGIYLHGGNWDNEYYRASRERVSPLSEAFTPEYLASLARSAKPSTSLKALLATEQRIPGLGNGVLQDILLRAGLHPRRRADSLTGEELDRLRSSIRGTLNEMAEKGGRDTERRLCGRPGGYQTLMCKNTPAAGCPLCGHPVARETYLGGAVYVCPRCQPMK